MKLPLIQRVIAVLWPSFIMAGIATAVFFVTFDPEEILAPTWFPELSRMAAYSVGFLMFWALAAVSSFLTLYFLRPINSANPDDG